MKPSDKNTSQTEIDPQAGFIPALRPDAPIEELDEWIRTLGGRELTVEESAKIRAEVRWHQIPGEMPVA